MLAAKSFIPGFDILFRSLVKLVIIRYLSPFVPLHFEHTLLHLRRASEISTFSSATASLALEFDEKGAIPRFCLYSRSLVRKENDLCFLNSPS